MKHVLKVLLFASYTVACGGEEYLEDDAMDSGGEAIIGGAEATPGEWPTAVSVQYLLDEHPPWHCGGIVISPTTILTARHCVAGSITANQLEVVVGRHDLLTSSGTEHAVSQIILHASSDVALLRLTNPISGVKPSRLVASARMSEIPAGALTTVVGWGRTVNEFGPLSPTLREVEVGVVAVGAACEAVTGFPSPEPDVETIEEDEICIGELEGGKDSCGGDSGGPAFIRRDGEQFVLGVVSDGYLCGVEDFPGIYVFSPAIFDWVHANTVDEPAPSLLPSAQIMAAL